VVKKAAKVVKPAAKKIVQKPMTKKIEVKKPIAKPVSVKKAPEKVVAPIKVAAPVKAKSPEKAKDIKITPAKPVVLPKINTKTSRKYQPDFTKSVLDQPKHDLGAPINRYSDVDLAEFREIIQRKLDSAKKELAYLQGLITRKDEMGGDNDDARYMTMEDGSMSMEREQLSQMASRQITFIDHLEKAVMRIENKTYGICRVTGQLIDKARLRAVPHATLSMEAKMGAAK
jgi:RNA polymerase-binding transcription factor DksA